MIVSGRCRSASAPFVRVDCAALPADQAEALLFGAVRGAAGTAELPAYTAGLFGVF